MRIALVLAAPFPLHQGSQVFVADQARALREAGARPTLFCYGAGDGESDPELPLVRTPARLTPKTLRSSASPAKTLADVALARSLVREHAREPFDAVLAHNSEAATASLFARRWLGIPIVYVVHTLLRHELSAYGPGLLAGGLDALGSTLERTLARQADGVIVLCEAARAALAPVASGPLARIPPGLEAESAPTEEEVAEACEAHGVRPGGFVLYTGNVDRYQDLDLLDAAAGRPELAGIPILVATHDPAGARFAALQTARVEDAAQMRALLHGCALALLPRRRAGGFPIKLLNYLEAGRPVIAHADVACGLAAGETAWLLPPGAGAAEWATAILEVLAEPGRADALGAAGRRHLLARHAWPDLAKRTLSLLSEAGASPRGLH